MSTTPSWLSVSSSQLLTACVSGVGRNNGNSLTKYTQLSYANSPITNAQQCCLFIEPSRTCSKVSVPAYSLVCQMNLSVPFNKRW